MKSILLLDVHRDDLCDLPVTINPIVIDGFNLVVKDKDRFLLKLYGVDYMEFSIESVLEYLWFDCAIEAATGKERAYLMAISNISDYIHKNPSDMQLLKELAKHCNELYVVWSKKY